MNKSVVQLLVLVIITFFVAKAFSYTIQDAKTIYREILIGNHMEWAPNLSERFDDDVNAQNSWGGVSINTAMLKFVKNKEELAMVLAHELGHWLEEDDLDQWTSEYEADRIGADLIRNIGYNVCVAKKILLRLHGGGSHPPTISRYQAIKC